jgi:hypothetical protein
VYEFRQATIGRTLARPWVNSPGARAPTFPVHLAIPFSLPLSCTLTIWYQSQVLPLRPSLVPQPQRCQALISTTPRNSWPSSPSRWRSFGHV